MSASSSASSCRSNSADRPYLWGSVPASSPASRLPQGLHQPQEQCNTCGSRLAGDEAGTADTGLQLESYPRPYRDRA
ncbi:hypothetical protein CXG50_20470 [Pseudomonas plecoglossicida]|nr:hypothetical protein CSW00_23730 [Pseudomonas sp. MR 02]PLP90690.1 hypothetical protein CX682_13980 [Pseudomonas sp. FFUP_PS_41]PLU99757.1 hypothetical protein CXG52_05845 [Pseudomonas plecoglossicida]QKK96454.1 hypothetical protein GEV38_10800 [Pseudomonas sp. 13159349]UPK85492.1 hypothetical protein E5221_11095 [Pseudomonas sp. A2]